MCGIVGMIDWTEDLTRQRQLLEKMTKTLTPRGPDAEGYWLSNQAAFGHRRLVVVDPEGGRQPMVRNHGGSTFVLTYNGELYNTAEIRTELIKRGYHFGSYSDTEVVLVSYLEWGPGCVEKFNGIYAFGIWSQADQKLFLARDRMGVKPLFYGKRGDTFVFASELKTMLAHGKFPPEVDLDGLREILGLGPARTPGNGVFKGIAELRPGCWLLYDRNGVKIKRYWSLVSQPHPDDLEVTTEKVRELVKDTIKRQLVSDVPVGTFLSGGLDSSIISAVAAEIYRENGQGPLTTYSIDYLDNEKHFKATDYQPNSDHPWAQRMAGFLGTDHKWVLIDTPQLIDALEPAAAARDLPGMADVDSSLYLFCREIKKGVTVALSGECADEVFGGYPWFYRPETVNADTFPWSLSLEMRNQILRPELRERLKLEDYVSQKYREALLEVPRLAGEDRLEARRRELFYLNINWFMALLLDRKDRMSMAHGLEVRVPFCDHRLVEYVWNIPWEMKSHGQREKGILRRAVQGILPDDVIYRKKSPYPKTHNPNYLEAVRRKLLAVLDEPGSPLNQLIDRDSLRDLGGIKDGLSSRPWFGQLMGEAQLYAYLFQMAAWLGKYRAKLELE